METKLSLIDVGLEVIHTLLQCYLWRVMVETVNFRWVYTFSITRVSLDLTMDSYMISWTCNKIFLHKAGHQLSCYCRCLLCEATLCVAFFNMGWISGMPFSTITWVAHILSYLSHGIVYRYPWDDILRHFPKGELRDEILLNPLIA